MQAGEGLECRPLRSVPDRPVEELTAHIQRVQAPGREPSKAPATQHHHHQSTAMDRMEG